MVFQLEVMLHFIRIFYNGHAFCHRLPAEPRTVVLHRARKGFGFVLRGAKAMSPLMELQPSERCPALQYLDDVDQGGVADMAGLRKGDYLLAVSSEFEYFHYSCHSIV
jgi:predicted metalloprotease with PDZ domain